MLLVGSPKINKIIEFIDGNKIENIDFKVESSQGLNAIVSHNSDDKIAKTVIKGIFASNPDFANTFNSVQICDEKGRIK